jgi:putative ABC transport system permease protein
MLTHYLSTSLRHFRRHKLTTGINVVCLAIGVASCAAAIGVVTWLSEADKHFAKAERIYVIGQGIGFPGEAPRVSPMSSWTVGRHLEADLPDAEAVARLRPGREIAVAAGEYKGFAGSAFADPGFLRIFDLPFLMGDPLRALELPRSAVITESLARRVFGTRDPLGKTLRLQNQETVTVTGVIAELRQPTHMRSPVISFDVLGSMDTYEAILRSTTAPSVVAEQTTDWTSNYGTLMYVLLPEDGSFSLRALDERLEGFPERRAPKNGIGFSFKAYALPDIQLSFIGSMLGSDRTGLSGTSILLLLGAMVLAASCVNYANLATALAYTRAQEVAMRRIVGASRMQIITQHLVESLTLALVAIVLVLAIFSGAVSMVSGLGIGEVLRVGLTSTRLWGPLSAVLLGVGIMAGAYPAFVLSRVRSHNALRSGRVGSGARTVPALLVGVQFAVASLMLIMLFVVHAQNAALQRSALTTRGEAIVVLRNDLRSVGVDLETLRSQLLLDRHVRSVTANQSMPWTFVMNTGYVRRSKEANSSASVEVYDNRVGYDFFETVGIALLAGRTFDRSHANDVVDESDLRRDTNVIIDDALAVQLGWVNPSLAVGNAIFAPTSVDGSTPPRQLQVIGVVETKPLVHFGFGKTSGIYYVDPTRATYPIVRFADNDVAAGLAALDATWERLAPDVPLQREFMDEAFERSFQTFQIVSSVFVALAGLAFGICVMGLVAMAIHMTERRLGEIGIRKTLGASAAKVLTMLLKDFSKPVLIANLLVWPLGFGVATVYFSLFMQRASLTAWPFIASLAIALTVAWLAVIVQAGRAARMKPAEVLRYE